MRELHVTCTDGGPDDTLRLRNYGPTEAKVGFHRPGVSTLSYVALNVVKMRRMAEWLNDRADEVEGHATAPTDPEVI